MMVGSILISFFTKLKDTCERNQRQHKHMERCTMFFDWMNQYYQNDYTTQSNLQIQYNPYQILKDIFDRIKAKFLNLFKFKTKFP